ncbi:MAG: HAD family hydrolase [Dehalococcoidia bacterium]
MEHSPGITTFKAIIFDWDQTVLDSWRMHEAAIAHVARTAGVPVPTRKRTIDTYVGRLEEHLAVLLNHTSDLTQEYLEFYQENHLAMSRLFPGIYALLDRLAGHGCRLGLLSNKRRSLVNPELDATGLLLRFQASLFRDEGFPMKPDPAGLKWLLGELDVSSQETLYVGDAPSDVECARRAHVSSAAAQWGSVDVPALLAANPDYRWQRVEDGLAQLLGPV